MNFQRPLWQVEVHHKGGVETYWFNSRKDVEESIKITYSKVWSEIDVKVDAVSIKVFRAGEPQVSALRVVGLLVQEGPTHL
jgi:hypothetical protein